ncbi:MAG: hypothetical protein NTV14_02870 [Coprothermobacterota bacterium]|nr:hypothetical protein [Coprothermobacterota bacterium]
MDIGQILTVVVIVAVLFLGYGFFTRYSRAKARQSRDPTHLVTKIYTDLSQFDYEAPKMLEGGYVITYVGSGKRYFPTEGLSLEQVRDGPLRMICADGETAFLVNYSR